MTNLVVFTTKTRGRGIGPTTKQFCDFFIAKNATEVFLILGWNGINPSQLFQRFRTVEQIYTFKLIFNTLLTLAHPWYFSCSQD